MTLKLYCDLMSQPSRALYIILKQSKTPFEYVYVNLRKGEHLTEEFAKINKLNKVPVIEHDGFLLSESVAIFQYLAKKKLISENYYPSSLIPQTRLNEFLNWQHIGLRYHLAMYFRVKYLEPALSGVPANPERMKHHLRAMENALDLLENKWLGSGKKFLVGDQITVADLLAACEIEQPRMAGYAATEKYPNISAWLSRVREHFHPHYEEAHITLNKIVKKYQSMQAKL